MTHKWYQDLYAIVRTNAGDNTQHDIGCQQFLLGKPEYRGDFTKYVLNQNQPKEDKNYICERMDNRWAGMTKLLPVV